MPKGAFWGGGAAPRAGVVLAALDAASCNSCNHRLSSPIVQDKLIWPVPAGLCVLAETVKWKLVQPVLS